ncbi:hypothetical protein KFD70_18145 [Bacillus pfraonensis]
MKFYQRFFKYIDHFSQYIGDSTRDIDQPTKNDKKQESSGSYFPTF